MSQLFISAVLISIFSEYPQLKRLSSEPKDRGYDVNFFPGFLEISEIVEFADVSEILKKKCFISYSDYSIVYSSIEEFISKRQK